MSGWVLQKAAEFCASVRDGTHDSPKSVEQGGKPLVTSKVVKQGVIRVEDAYLISEKDYRKINERSKVDRWDILMTMIGTVGECAIVKDNPDYAIKNIALFKMAGDEEKAKWLYYYLTSPMGQGALRGNFRGSSQQYISLDQLRNLEIPVPEKDVRSRIVAILSDYDSAIDNARRQIVLLEEAAMRLYREWFVVNADPRWGKKRLGDVCDCVLGGTPSRNNARYWGGDVAWINSGKVNELRIVAPSEFITREGLNNSATKILPKHTTVLAITGATLGQVSLLEIDSAANQSVVGILENAEIPYQFIYPMMVDRIKELVMRQTGGAQQHINKQIVCDLMFALPPKDVLSEYLLAVNPMLLLESECFAEVLRLTEARDRLLPKLMSGEIEV